MKLSEFDYYLPKELIAQVPSNPRDSSQLMVVNKKIGKIQHKHFFEIIKYLNDNDVLVFNDTKVFPARLFGVKETGGKVEVLIVKVDGKTSKVEFIGKNIRGANRIDFGQGLVGNIVQSNIMDFNMTFVSMMDKLALIGHTPLPPYINANGLSQNTNIRRRYQTVYAKNLGSAAAPTAGFHFTKKLLEKLRNKGVRCEFVTLHVGLGTFAPVKTERIEDHHIHSEYFTISQATKERIQNYKKEGKRIIAVGTTSVRVLESDWEKNETKIFIYPGYKFKYVDGLITNFHLPKSTLLMLVSAFAGKELIARAYREAVEEKYRFFSFGDAMLLI